jgi:hypothetical protein
MRKRRDVGIAPYKGGAEQWRAESTRHTRVQCIAAQMRTISPR